MHERPHVHLSCGISSRRGAGQLCNHLEQIIDLTINNVVDLNKLLQTCVVQECSTWLRFPV
jgi:hypothetical protein